MATLTRYLVVFTASAGIYNDGEEAALSADDYQRELQRKPRPLIALKETIVEEVDGQGKPVAGTQKRTPAPPVAQPADVSAKDVRIAELEAKVKALTEKAVLGSDPEKDKLQKSVDELGAQKAELEKKLAQAVEANTALEAEVARLKAASENREKTPSNKRG